MRSRIHLPLYVRLHQARECETLVELNAYIEWNIPEVFEDQIFDYLAKLSLVLPLDDVSFLGMFLPPVAREMDHLIMFVIAVPTHQLRNARRAYVKRNQ